MTYHDPCHTCHTCQTVESKLWGYQLWQTASISAYPDLRKYAIDLARLIDDIDAGVFVGYSLEGMAGLTVG